MEQKDLKYLFDNIKDGDAFFFYHKQWWAFMSKIIALFTSGKVDHVGVVLSVKKTDNAVVFNFSEQTFHEGGRFNPYSILKVEDQYELRGFSADTIYYGELKNKLTKDQFKIMLDDAKNEIGKKYGVSTLMKTLNWYDKMFAKKQNAIDTLRVCSTHAQVMYKKSGIITEDMFIKDDFYSPVELMNSGIFNVCKISDYRN